MDYINAFEISAAGMSVEKLRLETVSLNLANVNSTQSGGATYKPLKVISGPKTEGQFSTLLREFGNTAVQALGVEVKEVRPVDLAPKLEHDPNHPHANEEGFVAYPNINPVQEMMTLIEASRAYEANVQTLNAAKAMALRALEIGGK